MDISTWIRFCFFPKSQVELGDLTAGYPYEDYTII